MYVSLELIQHVGCYMKSRCVVTKSVKLEFNSKYFQADMHRISHSYLFILFIGILMRYHM